MEKEVLSQLNRWARENKTSKDNILDALVCMALYKYSEKEICQFIQEAKED